MERTTRGVEGGVEGEMSNRSQVKATEGCESCSVLHCPDVGLSTASRGRTRAPGHSLNALALPSRRPGELLPRSAPPSVKIKSSAGSLLTGLQYPAFLSATPHWWHEFRDSRTLRTSPLVSQRPKRDASTRGRPRKWARGQGSAASTAPSSRKPSTSLELRMIRSSHTFLFRLGVLIPPFG